MSGRNVIFAKQKIDGFASNASYGGLYTRDYNFPESGFEGTFKYSFTLEAGETYIVVWDGEEFPVIGQDAGAIMPGAVALGNCSAFDLDGNNEPFALATIAGSGVMFMSITETVDSHTVVIYQAGEDSLLPDTPVDFAYSSSFGVFAHSDFAPTFGIEAGQKYTIVWDNKKYARTAFTFTYADGSECVGLGNPVAAGQEGNNDPFCVVYDVTHSHLHYMSLEQDVSHTVAICQLAEGFDNGSVVLPEIRYDGFAHNSEANIYTLAITADSEYPLFDLVANETYTVYWDGEPYVCVAEKLQADDESEPVFAGNMHALGVSAGNENAPFIIGSTADRNELADLDDSNPSHSVSIYYGATTLHETVLSGFEQDNTGFYGVYFSPAIYQLEAGTEYIVIWDGVEYKVTAIDIGDIMDGFVFAGNGADFIAPDSGEPFAITSCSDSEYSETVFYALRDYDKEHTVEIYRAESSETVFMPLDDYQFIESTNDDGYTVYCTFWDGTLESGRRYRVNWEGTEQIMPARTFDDGTIYIGNLGITGVGDDTGEEFLIANSGDEGICLIATSDTGSSHRMGIWITNDPLEDPEEPAPEDPETPEDPEQAEGIILKDRNGDDVAYYGIETVTFDTTTEGKQQVYTKGEAVENVPVELNFASGDQIVVASEGTLVKSAIIERPDGLSQENIRKGVEIAGVSGEFVGDTEEVEVDLNFEDGDQIVEPSTEYKVISQVTIKQPGTLVPQNIAKGVKIAGVMGTFQSISDDDKPIRFHDPYGDIIYAYTKEEIQELEQLPPGPKLSGVTFERWTHTLDELKNATYFADVGPMYKYGSSPATILIVETIRANTSISVCLDMWSTSYKATVYWGDGSTSSLTGSSAPNRSASHTYASAGIHIISIVVTSGLANLGCVQNSYSYGILNNSISSLVTSDGYMNGTTSFYLLSILVGSYVYGGYPVCAELLAMNTRLKFVSLYNSNARNVWAKQFIHCAALKYIAGNTPLRALGSYSLFATPSLEKLSIDGDVNTNVFDGAVSLREVIYGAGKINYPQMNVKWAMLMTTETPPTIGATAPVWGTKPIYVPDTAVDAYKAASGWSAAAAYIVPASQYMPLT